MTGSPSSATVSTPSLHARWARSSAAPSVVYAGTTSEWQGAEVFIRAMPIVLESVARGASRLHRAGQRVGATAQSSASGLRPAPIDFVDAVPAPEAAGHLRSARVGVVSLKPGQGYDFAVPTKIFAALACGTPVLFAGSGASVAVITAGLGRSVDWDADAVAGAIIEMLGEPDDLDDRQQRARWARENASIAATGRAAAAAVEAAMTRNPRQSTTHIGRTSR